MSAEQQMYYSEKYYDPQYEYRHVMVPKNIARIIQEKKKLMTETEWRKLGIQQSAGWQHYMFHEPEPHIMLFRRLRTDGGNKKE